MELQKIQARKSWKGSGDSANDKVWFEIIEEFGPTEFLGYEKLSAEGIVQAVVKDGIRMKSGAQEGDSISLIVNQTPFYGESGGQVGDTGVVITSKGEIEINDTRKLFGKLWIHQGIVRKGIVQIDEGVELRVDTNRRARIQSNHSVTHLMHEALRQVLGDHVAQKGSLQDETRTRFDISQPVAITAAQLKDVEARVNDEIRANTPVVTRVLPLEDAMNSGARALFGEKYDDEVRVVSMGTQGAGQNHPYSVELCGGTHVKYTGDIGMFKIIAESAVSAGVRRIEALTGQSALEYFEAQDKALQDAAQLLKVPPSEVSARIESLLAEKKKLENDISNLRRELATGGGSANDDIKDIAGVKFIAKILPGFPAKDLKPMADELKQKLGSGVIALIATDDGKASIVVAVTDDLTSRISAVDLVKVGAEAMGGKGGGGRPDMAQAGGPNASAANDAVHAIEQKVAT